MGKAYQSVVVNAPAEANWKKFRDFHDMSCAPDVVSNVDVVGDKPFNILRRGTVVKPGIYVTSASLVGS